MCDTFEGVKHIRLYKVPNIVPTTAVAIVWQGYERRWNE